MKSFIKNQTLLIHYHLECTTAATKATKYCHQNVLRRDTDNYSYFLPNPKQPNHCGKTNTMTQSKATTPIIIFIKSLILLLSRLITHAGVEYAKFCQVLR